MPEPTQTPLLEEWLPVAMLAIRDPFTPTECPACRRSTMAVEWTINNLRTREADIDLSCSSCMARKSVRAVLPFDVGPCFPLERVLLIADAIREQLGPGVECIRQYVKAIPAAAFATHPLWAEAKWSATTFKWHPKSEVPPIMGLVFDNPDAGRELFREAKRQMDHEDRFEEIRVSIIEGPIPGQEQRPGYSVHICAEPEALTAHATLENFLLDKNIAPFIGQWNRHYPDPGIPALLPHFQNEFSKHNEFLLAPVVRRPDGKLYAEHGLGIIKNAIHFRHLSEITSPEDPDAAAHVLPQLITPPR